MPFVDLFTPSQRLYHDSKEPLTINGIHLNEHGDQLLAFDIDQALFGNLPRLQLPPGQGDISIVTDEIDIAKLRKAVLDKDFYWYNRYRVTDGYNAYGDRAFLKFSEGPGG